MTFYKTQVHLSTCTCNIAIAEIKIEHSDNFRYNQSIFMPIFQIESNTNKMPLL